MPIRARTQTNEDLDLLNTRLRDRSQITFKDGLRAITPLIRPITHTLDPLFIETVATVLFPTITEWLKVCGVSDTAAGTFRCDRC